MKCRLSNQLQLEGAPTKVLDYLDEVYTYQNPAWYNWNNMRLDAERRGAAFEEEEPPTHIPLHDRDAGLYPITAVSLLVRELGYKDLVCDNQLNLPHAEYPPIKESFRARPNQVKFLEDTRKVNLGLIRMPTGAGKTLSMLLKILELETTALIIVPNEILLRQTVDKIREFTGYECGTIIEGKEDIQSITVATYQSFHRGDRGLKDAWGVVMFDEVHKACGYKWSSILQMFGAKYRYGFSATYDRSDGGFALLKLVLGGLIHITSNDEMYQEKIIVPARVMFVESPHRTYREFKPDEMGPMALAIARHGPRNNFVTRTVRKMYKERTSLILTARVDHAQALAELLEDLNPVLFHGQLSPKKKEADRLKKEALEKVHASKECILIATHLSVGVGFDLPKLDTLFLAHPFSSKILTEQVAGRIMRSLPGKSECLIVDFVDVNSPTLSKFADRRTATYKSLGFTIDP